MRPRVVGTAVVGIVASQVFSLARKAPTAASGAAAQARADQTPPQTRCAPMLRCVVALLLVLAQPARALPRRQAQRPAAGSHTDQFAIMLDAGSSGTRAYVYGWPSAADCASRLAEQLVEQIGEGEQATPGLSFFAPGNISGVAGYLAPLVEFAQSVVPEPAQADTPIYLQATAGMRLLPEEQQEALLEAVRDVFAESPFDARPEETLVISGSAEGANEWTAVNCELPTPVADREREDCQSLCA